VKIKSIHQTWNKHIEILYQTIINLGRACEPFVHCCREILLKGSY